MSGPAPREPFVAWSSPRASAKEPTKTTDSGSSPNPHNRSSSKSLVDSDRLNKFVGGVIIANTLMLGLEIDLGPEGNAPQERVPWIVSETVFILIYMVEAVLRMWAERCRWLVSGWNWLDMLVLLFAILDTWWLSFVDDENNMDFLGLIRIVRLVRICRVLRLVRVYKALALALLALRESLNGLICVCFIMVTGIFCCSIFMTNFVGKTELGLLELGDFSGLERFGTVGRSMYSLFEIMTLEGWHLVGRPLVDAEPFMALFFFAFLMVFTFGLLNFLIAVVVERTLFNSNMGSVRRELEQRHIVDRQLQVMQEAFEACDLNQDGQVDRKEFEEAVHGSDDGCANAPLLENLAQLGITTKDALTLFDILDSDSSGEISFKEFRRGFARILGASDPLVDHCATRALLTTMTSELGEFRREVMQDLKELLQKKRARRHVSSTPQPPPPTPAHRPATPLSPCPDALALEN